MTLDRWTIAIDRDDIRQASGEPLAAATLAPGDIEVAITDFAMTANNITYAAFGKPTGMFGNDQGYWDFFSEAGTAGRLPVWGFATVTASAADGVAVGDRFYGYYPMASHAVLTTGKVGPHGFTDITPRRASLPPIYNSYANISALSDYRAADHDFWPVFRPLFLTGWLIADLFEEENDYGAEQILIASASSKTAIGLGYCIGQRQGARPQTIGLTSAANVAALAEQNIYDAVVAYDDIAILDASIASALVDIAGSGAVTRDVHNHFGDALKASIIVGKSHWDAAPDAARLPGPDRQLFFAPGRSQKRIADWGGAAFQARIAAAWTGFMEIAPRLAAIDRRTGADGALAAYQEVLAGKADPKQGIVVTP